MNTIDNTVFSTALNQEYNVYCDFNCDGSINTLDYTTFSVFLGKTVTYAPLALD